VLAELQAASSYVIGFVPLLNPVYPLLPVTPELDVFQLFAALTAPLVHRGRLPPPKPPDQKNVNDIPASVDKLTPPVEYVPATKFAHEDATKLPF
jgi:hypothetical protein